MADESIFSPFLTRGARFFTLCNPESVLKSPPSSPLKHPYLSLKLFFTSAFVLGFGFAPASLTLKPIDEALDRKPFIAQLRGSKPMKRISFLRRPITYNFERPHSKAEGPDRRFRRNLPSVMIATQSPRGEVGTTRNRGEGGGDIILFNAFVFVLFIIPSKMCESYHTKLVFYFYDHLSPV
jgi:hypothetical protein